MELTAALCSVKVSQQLKEELKCQVDEEVLWTDILGYIGNKSRRFHVFVANRVEEIQDNTLIDQWRYIESESNPADNASHGIRTAYGSRWITGPTFLWNEKSLWPANRCIQPPESNLECNDPEVKQGVALATITNADDAQISKADPLSHLDYFSNWYRAQRAVGERVRNHSITEETTNQLQVNDLEKSTTVIIKAVPSQLLQAQDENLKANATE